jgi:hypothetical protein
MGAAASVYAAKMDMALDKSQIVTGSKLAHSAYSSSNQISNGNFNVNILKHFAYARAESPPDCNFVSSPLGVRWTHTLSKLHAKVDKLSCRVTLRFLPAS